MKRRSKLEQVLEHLVNEEQEKAQELLHQYIVERARNIHEELMSEEDDVLEDEDFDPEAAEAEVEFEEMFNDSDLGEDEEDDAEEYEGDEDAEADLEDEMLDGEEEAEDGAEADDDDLEGKIAELEKELEALSSKFEELQDVESEEHGEDFGDEDFGDEDMGGEEDELDVDVDMEGGEEEGEEDLEEMENYTDETHSANRKAMKTDKYGENDGKAMSTDADLVKETSEGDKGNANKAKNSGYSKADPMSTDYEDVDKEGGSSEYDDSYAYKQAGWPGKAMSTESFDLDEEWDIFDSLDESVLDDLESVNVKMGGEQGGGKYAGSENETDSPIPQKEPAKRFRQDNNSRLTSKQDQHSGYDREDAPNTEHHPKYTNVRDTAASNKHGYKHVEKSGSKDAKLNSDQGMGDPGVTSPIGSKGTAGNKGVRGNKE